MVHGDDFVILAHGREISWLHEELKKKFDLKLKSVIGPEDTDDKSMRVLSRMITLD